MLALRDVLEALDLQGLAHLAEDPLGLLAADLDALERALLGEDLAHLRLDLLQVLGREGAGEAEVVLELLAVVLAAGVDLRLRPEPLDGVGQHVLGAVADELAGLRALDGEEAERPPSRSGRRRSTLRPSSSAPTASLARRGPIEAATSSGVVPAGTVRTEPSGRVSSMASVIVSIGQHCSEAKKNRDIGPGPRPAPEEITSGRIGRR